MNKILIISTTKSLLTLAIIASLGAINILQAADTATCDVGNCVPTNVGNSGTRTLSTPGTVDATNDLEFNDVTLDWTGALTSQPTINNVYGAYSNTTGATVNNNNVYIKAGTARYVYGGRSENGIVTKNRVHISGNVIGTIVKQSVYGGYSKTKSATENEVTISGGVVQGYVVGGKAEGGTANKNQITISGGTTVKKSIYGGIAAGTGNANSNIVTISDGTVNANVFGGIAKGVGTANDNTVAISGGTFSGYVFGGKAYGDGNADVNKITISNSIITKNIYGGIAAGTGTANSNNVTISNGTVNANVFGGITKGVGNANSNTVSISDGTVNKNAIGGKAYSDGNADDNKITISGANTVTKSIYGGIAAGGGNVKDNTISISDGTINGYVFGGITKGAGNANSNILAISGGTVTKSAIGGKAYSNGNADDNKITISGATTVTKSIYGGITAGNGDAKDNTVSISDGTINGNVFGGITKGLGNVKDNTVLISDGTVNGNVFGGKAYSDGNADGNKITISGGIITKRIYSGIAAGTGNANANIVTMSDGTVNEYVLGGITKGVGNANDNTVAISGGTVTKGVLGGRAYGGGNADENKITINGGTVIRDVFGGKSHSGTTINNTVTIKGSPTFGNNTIFHGGNKSIYTGNTLNIHTKGITVKDVKNFEHYNFYLGSDVQNGDTLLTLTGAGVTDLSNNGNNPNAKIKMGVETTNGHLQKGHKVTLIKKTTTGATLKLPSSMISGTPITAISGISTLFDFKVSADTNDTQLVAELDQRRYPPVPVTPVTPVTPTPPDTVLGRLNPQTKALLESGVAMTDFVNRGTDLAESAGFGALKDSQINNTFAFGATSAGKYRTETGSHIDVSGAEFMLGVGKNFDNSAGILSVGAFAEFGTGSFDAHNDFVGVPDVNSSGDAKYYGLGLMAKQEFNSGLSIKGGMSFGRTESDFNTTDILNNKSNVTNFDSNRDYFSAFAGLGYDLAINTTSKVNVYADIKHTNLSSDEQTIAGEKFHFDEINSTRTTLGARWEKDINSDGSVYLGAAWEHEFDGTASGSVNNRALAEPSLDGDTGIFEAGFEFNPANNKNLNITIGAQGTIGKRQGGSANASFQYDF